MCKPLLSPISSQHKFPVGMAQLHLCGWLVAGHQQEPGQQHRADQPGQLDPLPHVCCQDKQVCSCCYGDKLGPKAGLKCFFFFFLVFATETEQLMEEPNSLVH